MTDFNLQGAASGGGKAYIRLLTTWAAFIDWVRKHGVIANTIRKDSCAFVDSLRQQFHAFNTAKVVVDVDARFFVNIKRLSSLKS